uniref:Signal peptide, CUB and EGF-like domain-containing protein 2 n=1 Tax=Trichuris muris TaxID=70415 RepID=A0A5S6QI65_TRIMR
MPLVSLLKIALILLMMPLGSLYPATLHHAHLLKVNLRTGSSSSPSPFITFEENFTESARYSRNDDITTGPCQKRAVLKVDLSGQFAGVKVILDYKEPQAWSLHLSQSKRSSGFGNLVGNGTFETEVYVYGREVGLFTMNSRPSNESLFRAAEKALPHRRKAVLKLDIEHWRLRFSVFEHTGVRIYSRSVHSNRLFDLKAANRSLYIGLNRLISEPGRYGAGVCHASISLHKYPGRKNNCASANTTCDPNAHCVSTYKSYRCICKPGFTGNGQTCNDINECARQNGTCVQICENTIGSFKCSCYTGFALAPNGRDCIDVNECEKKKGFCHHVCVNTIGSYHCLCNDSYRLAADGYSCLKKRYSRSCDRLGCEHGCVKELGLCYCKTGYRMHHDHRRCIPTCAVGNGGCQHICVDSMNKLSCSCHAGYSLGIDNRTCFASCDVNNGGCDHLCENGSFGTTCRCFNGYRLAENKRTCVDIDECVDDKNNCQYGCVNEPGSYRCTCPDGYQLNSDGETCRDLNECLEGQNCDHICINKPGGFICECRPGYHLHSYRHCADIDECSIFNGGCEQHCHNTPGSHHCSCDNGYVLHHNGKDCIPLEKCSVVEKEPRAGVFLCNRNRCALVCDPSAAFESKKRKSGVHFSCFNKYNDTACWPAKEWKSMEIAFIVAKCLWVNKTAKNLSHTFLEGITQEQANCANTLEFCSIETSCERELLPITDSSKRHVTVLKIRGSFHTAKEINAHLLLKQVAETMQTQGMKLRYQNDFHMLKTMTKLNGRTECNRLHSIKRCKYISKEHAFRDVDIVESLDCSPGSYYDKRHGLCIPCSRGTYQPLKASLACIPCPDGMQTNRAIYGASNIRGCAANCKAGYFSETGFEPCRPCPKGYFQNEDGRSSCKPCRHPYATADYGTGQLVQCLAPERCQAGTYYDRNATACRACSVGTYQPNEAQDFCAKCPGNLTTDSTGSRDISDCLSKACRKVVRTSNGLFESPNYPNNYPANVSCSWYLKAPKGRRILIFVLDLDLADDHCNDYFVIRKNRSALSPLTFESCSSEATPFAVIGRSRRLWIEFRSDKANSARGFQIRYVFYREEYHVVVEDFVRDVRLYQATRSEPVFKNSHSLDLMMDILAEPEKLHNYIKLPAHVIPKKFMELVWEKLHGYFGFGHIGVP